MQFSVRLRNNRGNAIKATTGASPILQVRTGPPPANCAAANSGTLLASIPLAANWILDFVSGVGTLPGPISATAVASGDLSVNGHYRIWDAALANCDVQGTCTGPSAVIPGELLSTTDSIVAGGIVTINSYSVTEANA